LSQNAQACDGNENKNKTSIPAEADAFSILPSPLCSYGYGGLWVYEPDEAHCPTSNLYKKLTCLTFFRYETLNFEPREFNFSCLVTRAVRLPDLNKNKDGLWIKTLVSRRTTG